MNTISRILVPFITLLCPLVGGSLALDWVRFSKSNRLFDNVSPEHLGIASFYCLELLCYHCICIIKANGHYQQDSRALHHTFVMSTCWRFSCLGLGRQIFEIEPAVRQCITKTWRYTTTLLLIYW